MDDIATVLLGAFGFGILAWALYSLGQADGIGQCEEDAISAGVAEYYLDEHNKRNFRFKTTQPKDDEG